MSNGVRNLRAMFENGNAAASPEPRGRSPTDNAAATDAQERPKSKVRASFVSVEPTVAHPPTASTDLGQTKGTPSNSVAATRRESFRVSQDKTDELAELKKAVSEEKEQRRQSVAIPEAVPEQAVASQESSLPAPPMHADSTADMVNLGAIMKGSDFPDSAFAAAKKEAAVVVPAPEIDQIPVDETPAETPAETKESVAEAAPVPEPEPAPAQPAENPDKATTGAQEDVALKPAVPTEEAIVEEESKPALEEAAVDDDVVVAEENAIAEEAAVVEEAAIAEEVAGEKEAAAANEELSAPAPATAQPAENPDKPVTGVQEELALRPAAPTEETAVSDAPTTPSAPTEVAASGDEPAAEAAVPAESKAKDNGSPATKKSELKKPAAISTTKPSKAPAAPAKSPLPKAAPKPPTKAKTLASIPTPSPVTTTKPAAAPKPAAPKEPVKAPTAKPPVTKAPAAKVPTAKTSRTSLRPAAASSSSATAPTATAAAKAKPAAAPGENKKPAIPKPTTSAPRKRYVQYDLKQCAGTNTATAPHQLASRSQPRSRLPVQSACHLV